MPEAETTTEQPTPETTTETPTTETPVAEKPEEGSLITKGEQTETKTEEPKKEEAAPEAITAEQIKLPDGAEADPELMKEFLGILNDQNLSRAELAQKLVDMQIKAGESASEKNSQLWADTQKQWREEVTADTEFGGAKLQPNLDKIGKLLDNYGDDKLRELFDLTGAGNSIHMVKFLSKIADVVNEGGPVSGSPGNTGNMTPAQILYPNQGKE